MDYPFTSAGSIKLTSTTSNQTTAIPANVQSMVVYNAGANPVYLAYAATVAIPSALTAGVICVAPGSTQSFSCPISSSAATVAYIADTAGGTLVLSFGAGV